MGDSNSVMKADYVTVITFLIKRCLSTTEKGRTLLNLCFELFVVVKILRNLQERKEDTSALYGFHTSFIEAEQSLLFGHLTHPTPKSRQGILEWKSAMYSPELKENASCIIFGHIKVL